MENNDNQCFKWAVTRALNPVNRDSERVTKILKTQAEKYNWNDIEFPTKLKDIHKFEKNNNVNVNVFSFDNETKKVYTLRLSKTEHEETINLFLYNEHYGVVKDLSRLVSSQVNKDKCKKLICMRCLNNFRTLESLEKHLELCQNHDHQRHVYPNNHNKHAFFKQFQKTHIVPFVVYADFECFIEPTDNKIGKGTVQYQKHTPSGFCYTIKCMDGTSYEDKTVLYTAKEEGKDIGKKFVESLEIDLKEVYKILKTVVPINISEQEEESFKNAVKCYACGLDLEEDRVRDHCHLTGKYRGAAHSKCNLRMKTPKFVPVLFHNLEGYDSHLFVKSLGGEISCIPKTDEKYISFSKYIEINDNTRNDEEMRLIQAVRGSNWTREEISEMVDWTDEEIDQVLNLTDEECETTKLKPETLEIRFLDSIKFTLKSLDGVKGLGPDQFKSLEKEMGGNKLLKKKGFSHTNS